MEEKGGGGGSGEASPLPAKLCVWSSAETLPDAKGEGLSSAANSLCCTTMAGQARCHPLPLVTPPLDQHGPFNVFLFVVFQSLNALGRLSDGLNL